MVTTLDQKISTTGLLRFAAPTILGMILLEVFGIIDGLFVVHLIGTEALSALNITFPVVLGVIAIGSMFGAGGNALVARQLGQKRETDARQNFSLIVWAALGTGIAFSVFMFLFLEPILFLLGADEKLLPYCRDFTFVYSFFIPLALFPCVFSMFYITCGKAVLGMLVATSGGLIHIVLDYVFIGMYGMGLRGAGMAMGIGYSLIGVFGFVYFYLNRKNAVYFVRPKFRPYVIMKACTNGLSEMVTNLSVCVVTILMNNIVMRLTGSDGVAAITIILYMQTSLTSACFGYSIGVSPLISYNYGKRETDRLKRIFFRSIKMLSCVSVIVFLLCFFKADLLIKLFVEPQTTVYEMALGGSRLFAPCFLFMGLNIFASALFTAFSNGKVSAALSFCRTFLFVTTALFLLPYFWGMTGVWLSIPAAETLSFVMALYFFRKYKAVYHFA
ncbi:MAG: MATE family efflux transporter [Alphaproteobacteria bacterium]|nr:MATE family efflux transporter [Alphaproteobacteria bacterium]